MSHMVCPKCGGDFFVDTPGMNCPNCGVWMEGEKPSPSPREKTTGELYDEIYPPLSKEPTDEERATFTATDPIWNRPCYLWSNPMVAMDGASGDYELEKKIIQILGEAFHLWQNRQAKYGRGNIARTGAVGCYIRCEDKLARLHGVYIRGKGDMPDESISDSWLDLINYAVMGYACHHKLWPGLDQTNWYGETNAIPSTAEQLRAKSRINPRAD